MISLNLQDFPGVWLQPWRHRSLGSSLHRAFCSAPDPSCTTCHPESQLVSVLSSEQEGSQASCQVVEDPWLAGKAMAKLWLHRTSCSLVSSVMTILYLGLAWMVQGLCPSSFLTPLYPCTTLSFLGRNDWNLYLQASSSSRHMMLFTGLFDSPQGLAPTSPLSGSEQEGSFLRDLGNMFDYFRDWAVIMKSAQMFSPRLLLMLPTMISTPSRSCVLCTFNDFKAITDVNASCLISPVCNKHVSIRCIGVFQKSNNQIEKGFCYIPFIVWTHSQH